MFHRRSELVQLIATAEHGNLLAAARALGLTQPTLSYTIAQLEKRIGVPLFERLTAPRPGVRLTPLGEAAARHARRILREHEAGEEQFASLLAGREGRVRVAASAVFLQGLLPGTLAAFHEEFPGIEVELRPAGYDAPGLLAEGRIDLYCGIMGDDPLPEGLRCDALQDTAAGIVARRDHPLQGRDPSREDLAGYPWIVFGAVPDDEDESLLDDIRRRAGRPVQRVVRCGPDGLYLMQAGDYLAELPLECLDRLPGGFLAPLRGEPGTRTIRAGILSRHSDASLPAGRLHGIVLRAAAPAVDDKDGLVRLTLSLPYELHRQLGRRAQVRGMPVTKVQWILAAARGLLEDEERAGGGLPATGSAEARGQVPPSRAAPDPGGRVKLSVRVPRGLVRRIDLSIARRAWPVSRQQWLVEAIVRQLAREEPDLDVSIDISRVETTDEWGDEAVEATADRAPRNLDEMLEVLRTNAVWPGAPLAHGKLDWTSLPVYGGPDVPDTMEVWSWDDERMLVGSCSEELRIVERAEGTG